jgi:hypothetical protein
MERFKNTHHEILEAMTVYGGGFVRQLAVLYRLADLDNQRKLATAFENYFRQYDELATRRKEPETK